MLTAHASPELAEASQKLGAAGCVGKPFVLDEIAALVTTA
jgi:DNA-binding NarL/FixJ family response regulator